MLFTLPKHRWIYAISAFFLISCTNIAAEQTMDANAYRQQGWQIGTVTYLSFEGGFYGIVSESGDKLLPMNMAAEMKVAGNIIAYKGKVEREVVTIQQWGTPYTLNDIALIKKGSGSTKPLY
ncbi:hypothetical protein [Colwellia sp. MEBiC06753]